MTLEEAQAKIVELEGIVASKATELTTSQEKVTKLNAENAERRVINTQQKKVLHVAKQVLGKNNIKVDLNTMNTENLSLNAETGQVEGEVTYNPASIPEVGSGVPPSSKGSPAVMTRDTIQEMSRAEIAKNWEQVSTVLTGSTPTTTTSGTTT